MGQVARRGRRVCTGNGPGINEVSRDTMDDDFLARWGRPNGNFSDRCERARTPRQSEERGTHVSFVTRACTPPAAAPNARTRVIRSTTCARARAPDKRANFGALQPSAG